MLMYVVCTTDEKDEEKPSSVVAEATPSSDADKQSNGRLALFQGLNSNDCKL
jgi:hypothetical protein